MCSQPREELSRVTGPSSFGLVEVGIMLGIYIADEGTLQKFAELFSSARWLSAYCSVALLLSSWSLRQQELRSKL